MFFNLGRDFDCAVETHLDFWVIIITEVVGG
jgi:hypothetical protein